MPLKVEINVRNLELSKNLRDQVVKKVAKLDRFLDSLQEAKVDLSYAQSARSADDRQVAQLTVRGKGVLLRAEERTNDILASVDAVMEKIARQIERYKGRRRRGRVEGRTPSETMERLGEAEVRELSDSIVRRKRFALTSMFESEAVEQMSLLGHESFFIFLNGATGEVNVLYRRRDGSLGLIETEIA